MYFSNTKQNTTFFEEDDKIVFDFKGTGMSLWKEKVQI